MALASGCTRAPPTQETQLKPGTVAEVERYVAARKVDIEEFRLRGPFAVTAKDNYELRVSATETVSVNVFLAEPKGKAPLVIFMHGYDSSKEAHANQALHLASWGVHAITVQLARKGPWVANGIMLARVVNLIHRSPEVIDSRIDVERIMLVGHSFGGAAVAIALSEGARAAGGVLLDPAVVGRDLPRFLQRVDRPIMVLGADEEVASTRNREYFFYYIRRNISEISIKDASHEDAQWPSEYALRNLGYDPDTTEAIQVTFASAITLSALSLSSSGTFDQAWASFAPAFASGKFFNAKKK